MSYPQPPQNDPNQYPQQPYQQPGYPQQPYQQPGTPGTPNMGSVNFAAITTTENRPYLIAAIGGLIAFLGYFILPYYGFSYHISTFSESVNAKGSDIGSWLVLSMLGGLVALVVAALVALGIRAIPQLTPQLASRVLIGAGVASAIGLVITFLQGSNLAGGSDLSSLSDTGLSYGFSFGFWLAILATIAMIVGGVMSFRRTQ